MTHYLLFSGKGGVGKTSLSSAAAVALAQKGLNTLLVTTDPASNLGDVFGQPVGLEPQPVEAVNGLFVQAIDSKASLAAYKERALAPLRVLFPETIVHAADEKMSGPCTEEMATFDPFIACLRNPAYDWVVFDTAPTGHTLRLLELPVTKQRDYLTELQRRYRVREIVGIPWQEEEITGAEAIRQIVKLLR
ncbi:ArsA family ATPase [Sulfobacillus sp. hq2]|uniref:ArsA family ATPase n=1 Tax=Sulfobacillus TaxID=28033 RepID=UPI000CD19A35|nr:ArsA family ATPase [Sulfobacillus sp. hq2]POB11525.1 hypothetical protein CO251_03995 [Sulfobacillus sp. hq2]